LAHMGCVYHRGSSLSFVGKMPRFGQNRKYLARNLLRLTRMGRFPTRCLLNRTDKYPKRPGLVPQNSER